jgi:head-tail adaptor
VTRAVRLTRRMMLETREAAADGAGGQAVSWRALGALWVEATPRTGREVFAGERPGGRVQWRMVVRAAPMGAPSRPRPDQRLREGARVFDIVTVAERDPEGRFLEIIAEEGVAS